MDNLASRVIRTTPVKTITKQFFQVGKTVSANNHHGIAIQLLDAATVIGYDLAQFRQNQIKNLLQAQRAAYRLCRSS